MCTINIHARNDAQSGSERKNFKSKSESGKVPETNQTEERKELVSVTGEEEKKFFFSSFLDKTFQVDLQINNKNKDKGKDMKNFTYFDCCSVFSVRQCLRSIVRNI